MNVLSNLSAQQLRRAADIQEKIAALQDELLQYLEGSITSSSPARRGKRTMSAAGRARIIAAQKARWAKVKAANRMTTGPKAKKRTMSAAAKAKIAAAARARWARAKAAGKKAL